MGIRSKLLINALVSVLCIITIGGVGLFTINFSTNVSFSLFENGALPVIRISKVEKNAQEFMMCLVTHCAVSEHEVMEELEKEIDTILNDPVFKESKEKSPAFQKEWDNFVQIAEEIIQLSREFLKEDALNMLVKKGRAAYDRALSVIRADTLSYERKMEVLRNDASDSKNKAVIWIGIFTLTAILTAFTGGMLIAGSIYKPVNRIVNGLSKAMNQVGSVSKRVSSSSQQLAGDSSIQASSLEETSSSLEEMSSMTRQNANNANEADKLMKESNHVVTQANNSMNRLTLSMEKIGRTNENTLKIIKTIDEIAFQTNLLALNAAVEAARAGETGTGFAVVAEEVRNLAIRATKAAKNTSSLIDETIKSTNEGAEAVTEANEAFSYMLESTSKVGYLVSDIAATSDEQARGIEEINKAVAEVDRVVQQNALSTEELAGVSEEMYSQSRHLENFAAELTSVINRTKSNKN